MLHEILISLALGLVLIPQSHVLAQDRFRPLTQEMLNQPDPADWLMWRG